MSKEDKSKIDKISISTLEISNLLTTGKKIATISVGSTSYNILAPATYAWSEITDRPTKLSQFTDDVVSGKYLPLTGGTINGMLKISRDATFPLLVENTLADDTNVAARFRKNGAYLGALGFNKSGTPIFITGDLSKTYTLLHTGNVGEYALKTDGSNVMHAGIQWPVLVADDWDIIATGARSGLRLVNSAGQQGNGAPSAYSVGLSVSGYYGFNIAYNASDRTAMFKGGLSNSDWKTIAFTDSDITGNAATATKLAKSVSLWGNTFDGTQSLSGDITLANNTRIRTYSQDGNTRATVVYLDASNQTHLGGGSLALGSNTFIQGKSIILTVGESGNSTTAMTINSSGNVTIGQNNSAGGNAKLYVDGSTHVIKDLGGNYDSIGTLQHNLAFAVGKKSNAMQIALGVTDDDYGVILCKGQGVTNQGKLVINPLGGYVGIGKVPTSALDVNGNVKATSFIGNLDGTYVNKLTGYVKATAISALAATDTLNAALGKLEYKADVAYNLVKGAYDGDGTIENLEEILRVLDGIKDTETIKAIIGKYLPLSGGELTGSISYSFVTSGGDATGWWYKNNGTRVAGIGALGESGTLQHIFLGWGTSPWLESNSLAVSDTKLKYKGFDIIHAGNWNQFTVSKDNLMTYVNNNTDYVAANLPTEISKVAVSKYIEYWDGSTGGNGWFNSKWGTITAVNGFVGNVTGNVTGNASSATKLQTARTIWGQSFNGTNNISGDLFLHPQNNDGNALSTNLVFTGYNGFYYGPIISTKSTSNVSGYGRKDLVFLQHNNAAWPSDINSHIEVMRITTNGNIGIGTSAPEARLHINGSLLINNTSSGEQSIIFRTGTASEYGTYDYKIGKFTDANDITGFGFAMNQSDGSWKKFLKITTTGTYGVEYVDILAGLTVSGYIHSSGFVKFGSNNNYLLLGGGGQKAISDFMLKSDELTNNLTTITKSLTVTSDWMDTGISSTNIPTNGTYIVQVRVHNSTDNVWYGYWSGVMSWYASSTNDNDADEIILHRAGHGYTNTIYLRTVMQSNSVLKLQIAANKTLSTAATYTFKFKRVI